MKRNHNAIGTFDLLAIFGRALLIQAAWSFERMQTIGFAYALEPVLRKLYPDRGEFEKRLKAHMDYFNTQPYFASFILGAAVRLEEDRASGRNADTDIAGLKATLMAPLGALGDSFFWGALKPMAAVIAVAAIMTGNWWAPLLFLAIFNAWHIGLRLSMLFWGYANGGDAVALMARYGFTKIAKRFKIISLASLGGILGLMPLWSPEFKPAPSASASLMLSGLVITLILVAFVRKGGSPVKLMLGLAAICFALAYTGVI